MMYVMTAAGLVVLFLASETLVRGSVGLARSLCVPPLLIGLTVVAFGTSAPELFVGVKAAFNGLPALSLGNIVGSNIANIWLVLGVSAMLAATPCNQPGLRRNLVFMLGATAVFILFAFDGEVGRASGVVLLLLLAGFLGYSIYKGLHSRAASREIEESLDDIASGDAPLWLDFIWLIVGLVGLPVGAHLVIRGGEAIAHAFGVSDALIGLTIVAIGTSLPELATTIAAAVRKHVDVAVGNVIGSNLFNLLAIGGVTASLVPLPVPSEFLAFDFWVMTAAAVSLLPFALLGRNIRWLAGFLYLFGYIGYLTFIVTTRA